MPDTGTGMDEATLKRATEPFFTTKGAGKGTGLGLSMVHGLAAQSGGAMRITSQLGDGTTVELWLPVAESTWRDRTQGGRAAGDGPHLRVLVVDDDPMPWQRRRCWRNLGTACAGTLGAAGVRVVAASHRIDLVVTDQAMPGMTGWELAGQSRSRWPELPIILASGYADLPTEEDPGWPRLAKRFSGMNSRRRSRVFSSWQAAATSSRWTPRGGPDRQRPPCVG